MQGKNFVGKCTQRTEKGVAFPTHVGTQDVARDTDVLRSALGDEKLTYLGYSYGAKLGNACAAMFPRNVRALLLDSAVDPSERDRDERFVPGLEFDDDPEPPVGFDVFAEWCTALPDCALGADKAAAWKEFDRLTSPLTDRPANVRGGRVLSRSDAKTAVRQAMYADDSWVRLNRGLNQLKQGEGTALMDLADGFYSRDAEGSYGNERDAFDVINCVDLGCDGWPEPAKGMPPITLPIPGLPPVLVVSTTKDAVIPLAGAQNLSHALPGGLLTVEANRHGAFLYHGNRNPCVDDAGTAYLVDLRLPDNTHC